MSPQLGRLGTLLLAACMWGRAVLSTARGMCHLTPAAEGRVPTALGGCGPVSGETLPAGGLAVVPLPLQLRDTESTVVGLTVQPCLCSRTVTTTDTGTSFAGN